jgi:hypothetical protein
MDETVVNESSNETRYTLSFQESFSVISEDFSSESHQKGRLKNGFVFVCMDRYLQNLIQNS